MEYYLIALVSFSVAILTFFSGFGLGTILTPVFMIFFPVETAIALTGVVHFFNNIFKIILVGKKADKDVFIRFGVPAVLAALLGSWILITLDDQTPLFTYRLLGYIFHVYTFKLFVAILLLFFAAMDLIPYFNRLQFSKKKLPLGGMLSGFFGGLTGNQGALRAAFLIKSGLSKEAFVGTTVLVSTCVDFTRLSMYATKFLESGLAENWQLVLIATVSGISGSFLGNRLLEKVTIHFLKVMVAVLLIILSVALGSGWL